MITSQPASLYFHIPFCVHRCAYCDFNTYAGQEDSIPAYVRTLCREIQAVGESAPEKVKAHTVFFGGGTPSLISAAQYERIFDLIHAHFDLTSDAEISLEANPGTCSLTYLRDLRSVGFNRISFGVQSANPGELRMLERNHTYSDVVDAVRWSRQAGFDNLNLDLIYGLPGQTMARWQSSLDLILGLRPEHLSLYALTVEHGTPFGRWASRGLMPIPNPDLAAEMYEWAEERLDAAGYEHYEISNWALPGHQCRHNLQYWRNLPYLGFGAGAHGYAAGYRYSNVLRIKTYIDRCIGQQNHRLPYPLSPATVNHHRNTQKEDMQETMMTSLRLTQEGITTGIFHERFGVTLEKVFGTEVDELIRLGLLEWAGAGKSQCIRITKSGRLLGNQVFMRFVGD